MMRRLAVPLLLALVLGVTTSVALAWVRAVLVHPALGENRLIEFEGWHHGTHGEHGVTEYRSTGATCRLIRRPDSRNVWYGGGRDAEPVSVPGWSVAGRTPPPEAGEDPVAVEKAFGWPLRCVRVGWGFTDHSIAYAGEGLSGGVLAGEVRWGLAPVQAIGQPDPNFVLIEEHRAIPLRPIWLGLIGSTALWSLPWVGLVVLMGAPGALVRCRRRRGGRCVPCGYPIPDGSSCCPECGTGVAGSVALLGRWVLRGLVVLTVVLVSVTVGFGVWRVSDGGRMPPVHLAAATGDTEALARLITAGEPLDRELTWDVAVPGYALSRATPLTWAAARGQVGAVRVLLDAGVDPSEAEGEALVTAALHGHAEVCRVLLDAGADPTLGPNGSTALAASVWSGDRETEALLRGVPETSYSVEALRNAVLRNPARADEILASERWSDEDLESVMMLAIEVGSLESVRALLRHGAQPSAMSVPLLWTAASVSRPDIMALLIESGADVTIEKNSDWRWSPIRRAVVVDCVECFELLVGAGADPMHVDGDGDGLLHHAAVGDDPAMLEGVLGQGVPLDRRNGEGKTALMAASFWGKGELVARLLAAGADPELSDDGGHTALDHARGLCGYGWYSARGEPVDAAVIERLVRALRARGVEPD